MTLPCEVPILLRHPSPYSTGFADYSLAPDVERHYISDSAGTLYYESTKSRRSPWRYVAFPQSAKECTFKKWLHWETVEHGSVSIFLITLLVIRVVNIHLKINIVNESLAYILNFEKNFLIDIHVF